MRRLSVHEAKTNLARPLEEVEAGEHVIIVRAGEPVAVLVPYRTAMCERRLGLFPGQAKVHSDFDELPADIAAALGGS